jgi:GEVED domain
MIHKKTSSLRRPKVISVKRWLHKLRHLGLSFLVFIVILFPIAALATLSIAPTVVPLTILTALQGSNVTISNVVINEGKTTGQVGTFSGGLTGGGAGPVIGINDGVVMVTGDVKTAAGPNNNSSITTGLETGPTDPNLTTVDSGTQFDTAVLQFNVVPAGKIMAIDFAFASDEYKEFVCSQFNDAMGIFVSGPGITGTANVARVSTTLKPISINQINRGIAGSFADGTTCDLTNSAFYVKNIADATTESGAPNSFLGTTTSNVYTNLQYDGFTVPLTAQVGVIPNQTYTIKVVIADIGDAQWDSAIFIDVVRSFDLDLGDAPDSYGTKPVDQTIQIPGVARHSIGQDIYLGAIAPDAESTVTPATSPNDANNDDITGIDDEDAFSGDIAVPVGATSFSLNSIVVHNGIGATAKLMGWIDFNKSGVFDSGELATATVSSGATTANLSWSGLSGVTAGTTYARFRLTTDTNLTNSPSPIGLALNGEVEDYRVIISNIVNVSGTVFDDADGSKVQNGTEAGTNGGGLNAVLVNSSNKVVASTTVVSTPVASIGTYSFSNVPANATYTVLITTNTATVGSAPPTIALPSNWVSTGENLNAAIDGAVDSKLSVSVITSNVTGANFGIEQRPTAVGGTAISQPNPGTLTTVLPNVFTGSTDLDGTVASYKITAFPSNASSIEINSVSYTSATFPGSGVTVTAAQLNTIKVFPNSGTVTVGISFQAIDNAGQSSSNTATANLPFQQPTAASVPELLLVKRITAINGSPQNGAVALNTYDPDSTYPYDKNVIQAGLNPPSTDLWPNTTGATSSTFLVGARNGGTTKPGDEVEYTIYFLSAGSSPAKNAQICDRIPPHQIFVPDAFNSLTAASNTAPASPPGDRGIAVSQGSTTYAYTNIGDGDTARYYPPSSTLPSACTQPALTEDNGAIVVNLGDVSNATTSSNAGSYGFVRFQAKVK